MTATSARAREAEAAEQRGYDARAAKDTGPNPFTARPVLGVEGDLFLARAWMAGWRRHAKADPFWRAAEGRA